MNGGARRQLLATVGQVSSAQQQEGCHIGERSQLRRRRFAFHLMAATVRMTPSGPGA